MPQGCDFWCDNESCQSHGKTIVMHGNWPTMCIDDAIASVGADAERRAALEARKLEGRKVALFVYPEDKNKSPAGYRIQLYCPSCLVVEDKDCSRDPKDAIKMAEEPPACGQCGGKRESLKSSIKDSIACPTCKKPMKQFHWFTK